MDEIGRLLHEWSLTVIGFVGAVIGSYFNRDELKSKADFFWFIISGWFFANFLTSPAVNLFKIDQDSTNGVAFLLGATGGSIIAALVRFIRTADWSTVKQYLPGGGN